MSQKTAWFMLQRIRKAWNDDDWPFGGPVEVDETFIGGRRRSNKHTHRTSCAPGEALSERPPYRRKE